MNRITKLCGIFLISIKCSSSVQTELVLNQRPIIGILAQEIFNSSSTYIAASYVKFVEGAGAQAVPIFVDKNEAYVKDIFSKINGVLFPGGSIYFPSTPDGVKSSTFYAKGYAATGRLILRLARLANDAGDYFPIWGTCLGFELLIYDAAKGVEVRASCGASNVVDKLKYTKETMTSQLFGKAPKSVVNLLSSRPLTANFHNLCLTPANFTKFGLNTQYSSLSINYDPSHNLSYISTIEHLRYPFYGVQFHPEKNLYEWTQKEGHNNIPHSPDAIRVAQYFANFFVNQARRNTHKFPNLEEENNHLIYNYRPTFTGANGSAFVQEYIFAQNNEVY